MPPLLRTSDGAASGEPPADPVLPSKTPNSRASPQPPTITPADGQRMRVLATAAAEVTDTQSANVTYALTLAARAGRWEITAIDPTPAFTPQAPADQTAGTAPTPTEVGATTTQPGTTPAPTTP